MKSNLQKYSDIAKELQESDARNRSFWETLKFALSDIHLNTPPKILLNVACGDFEEARVLASFFTTKVYGIPNFDLKLIGIDINPVKIQRAHALLGIPPISAPTDSFVVLPHVELILGDATNLSQYPQIPDTLDFILLRHQFIAEDLKHQTLVWQKILKEAIEKLSSKGILLITSFKEAENILLLRMLSTLNCKVIKNEQNPHSISLEKPESGVGYDKWVTLVIK